MPSPLETQVRTVLDTLKDPVTGQGLVASGRVSGLVARADGKVGFVLETGVGAADEPLRKAAEEIVARVSGVSAVTAVLTAEAMRQADRRTIADVGLPGSLLMENAGAAVASWRHGIAMGLKELATTGDGILTGLHIAAEVVRTGKPLSELTQCMKVYPQVLVNVRGVDRTRANSDEVLQQAVRQVEELLAGEGRVLLRPSGTEPVVRVMVEAAHVDQAQQLADDLASIVKERLAV